MLKAELFYLKLKPENRARHCHNNTTIAASSSSSSMAGAAGRVLFTLSLSSTSSFTCLSHHAKLSPLLTRSKPFLIIALNPRRFRPLCSVATAEPETSDPEQAKHSILLERLRIRHLKDTFKAPEPKPKKGPSSSAEGGGESFDGVVKKKKNEIVGSFEELGLSDEVMGAVREMGIEVPTEIQCLGVPSVLEGQSVVLGSHTGSGKTLAYLLPLVQLLRRDEQSNGLQLKPKRPRAVVLCPTRELSEQVFRVAKSISHHARFRCTMVSGGGRLRPQEDSLNNPIDMVVGTPGRILQHIEEGNMVYGDIKYLVLDEADTMFDRGFGPDIRKFLGPLKHRASKSDGLGFQTVLVLEPSLAKGNRVMVFCNTLDSSRAVDHFLVENQISTVNYHGEVPAEQRVENLKKFKSDSDDCPTLVCTDLAARGLDLDVDHVVMFDFPLNSIDYLHRTGRTARMGAKGKVTSLVTKRDSVLATRIEEAMRKNESLEAITKESVQRDIARKEITGQRGKDRKLVKVSKVKNNSGGRASSGNKGPNSKSGKGSLSKEPIKKGFKVSNSVKSSSSSSTRKVSSSGNKQTSKRAITTKSTNSKLSVVGFKGRNSSSNKKQSS